MASPFTLMDAFLFTVAVLATFRIAMLVVLDEGPLKMFGTLRAVCRGWRPEDPLPLLVKHVLCGYDHPPTDGVLFCPYCAGVWIAGVITGVLFYGHPWHIVAAIWFAVAGGAAFLERTANHY